MSQFNNFALSHVYNTEIDEYVNKMWEMSVKIGSYNRWIAILDTMKRYKDNHLFTIELTKTTFKNIDDKLYNPEIILRDTGKTLNISQRFQRPDNYPVINKDLRDFRMRLFYERLEQHFLFHNSNMVKDLKSRIRACGFDYPDLLNMMNIDFQICPEYVVNMCDRTIRRVRTELVKITKKLVKHNDIYSSGKKVSRTLRHNQYYLVPNIIMEGEFNEYDTHYLDMLMEAYGRVVEYYKKHILELYLELGIDKLPEPELLNKIEERFDVCCVCYETTNYYTNCNHVLCDNCYNQIPNKICPICRRDLNLERLPMKAEPEEKVETFDGETKEIEEEPVIYYDTEYQELYDRFKLFTDEDDICDENGDKFYRIYYKTNITDLELLRLHPTLMRNSNMKYKYKEHYTGVFIKIN
jgi:hypothetical protein